MDEPEMVGKFSIGGLISAEDEEVLLALDRIGQAEKQGLLEPMRVLLGPVVAFVVTEALQLARRHPDAGDDVRLILETVGRGLQNQFHPDGPSTGVLYRHLEKGWEA